MFFRELGFRGVKESRNLDVRHAPGCAQVHANPLGFGYCALELSHHPTKDVAHNLGPDPSDWNLGRHQINTVHRFTRGSFTIH